MRIKQSVCFPMMEPLPLSKEEFFARVAQMGYAAVEIWNRDQHSDALFELAKKHGLRIASFSGHNSLPVGLNDPSQHERICAELRESIDAATYYNVPGVICFSGNRRPNQSEADAIEACAQGFRMIAPYAEEKGVNLNMELLNTRVDHPGYQCDHTDWGMAVVERAGSPRVKLLYDIYHMQIMEGDLIRNITANIQSIGHFHTAGVPGRNELDDTQEINYRAVCKAIAATGYEYFMGHEYRPTRDLMQSLQEAFTLCDQQ